MLMNIKCSAVTSVAVHLEFDDGSVKDNVIAVGDIIDVEYNYNGCRRRFQGKVIKISCVGTDPKGWSIIVDGSGDFDSDQARFSPASILDLEVIHKSDTIKVIQTPNDITGIPYLRIVKGRLQYSMDGVNWMFVCVDKRDVLIKDEEGTVPDDFTGGIVGEYPLCHNGRPPRQNFAQDDDIIKDEVS